MLNFYRECFARTETGIYFNWILNVLKPPLLFLVFLTSSYSTGMMLIIIIQDGRSPTVTNHMEGTLLIALMSHQCFILP